MIQTKYAIVIVTYNRKHLLQECIARVEKQTVPAGQVIIVNNASVDGTKEYLEQLTAADGNTYQVIECKKNIGGAGGFSRGIEQAAKKDIECILIIDDDAMIAEDYMEKLLIARERYAEYKAFAGKVEVNGRCDIFHRKTLSRFGLQMHNCDAAQYRESCFACDIASFCGMLVDRELVEKIGYPHAEYFIWHDDTEYSLRIHEYSRILVVTDAVLDHRTEIPSAVHKRRRYGWKDYYAIRNRIWYVKEHGRLIDRMINSMNLFVHVVFRNWLFGLIKVDHYDWKPEQDIVRRAIKDAHCRNS